MSGEYELKKDRDRQFWQGGFLWSGQDYIGEPTPYDVFPVKSSFFGAVDEAGFPKDAYYLFKSQWTTDPMVHIVPMNWTDYQPGQPVAVWVYANVATVELFLNGKSLGAKSFGQKVTTFGRQYLETTEPTGDDYNYPSGSYTSPNGSTGKLHLTWTVPFQPGRLTAVATQNGRTVASDSIVTAGPPRAITLTPGTQAIPADGTSLAFIAVEITDRAGVLVPGAGNLVQFSVEGPGMLAGVDNGQQENPQSYQASSVPAFNGRALVIVQSAPQGGGQGGGRAAGRPGDRITVTATSPGLRGAQVTLGSVAVRGGRATVAGAAVAGAAVAGAPVSREPAHSGSGQEPTADASYSGAPGTVPAAMLDGDQSTGWSNYYHKAQTANLLAVSVSNPSDWVALSWPQPQSFDSAVAYFTTGGPLALPATIAVSYWDGREYVPVRNLVIDWATASGQPTTLTFDPVRSTRLRLDMTSAAPGTGAGFLMIAELQARSNGVKIR
jgi:beta-galactosidase